jgi:hypothetical protein
MSGRSVAGLHAQARRVEEMALNASGAFQSLLYDGWLLGHRVGPTKRQRYLCAGRAGGRGALTREVMLATAV